MQFIEIDYPALMNDPGPAIEKLVKFIGQENLPNETRMAGVIDPSLHRQRKG